MKAIKWYKGHPPSIGWWPASVNQDTTALRWWDGKCWSFPAFAYEHSANQAAQKARTTYPYGQEHIEWTERWWLK